MIRARILAEARASNQRRRSMCVPDRKRKPEADQGEARPSGGKVQPNVGPYASEDDALREVVGKLVRAHDPEAIWLFGSRARGDHRPDSDFDLLVLVRPADLAEDYDRVYGPVRGLGVGCDVVPCPADAFAQAAAQPGTLCFLVAQEGRPLYERR